LLISCIIPTCNRPDFIVEAAASVLSQSHANLELIIINDGTLAIPHFSDARVSVMDSGQAGAVGARNLGVAQARGEAIAWLDDDDVWTDQHFLTHCAQSLEQGSGFIYGDGHLVFPDGLRKAFTHAATAESLKHDNTILISAVCYKRNLHAHLGMFDDTLPYYWDWDWYLRVAAHDHALLHLPTPVVDIRIHAQNMSGQANLQQRTRNLARLCMKHNLVDIPLKSHIDFV
jgi:glycosyltransferase involved in cell wall biosynthesis